MAVALLGTAGARGSYAVAQGDPGDDNKLVFAIVVDQIFNRGNLALADAFVAKDVISNGLPVGRDGFKTMIHELHTSSPDLKLTVSYVMSRGDRVIGHVIQIDHGLSEGRVILLRIDDGLVTEQWDWPDPLVRPEPLL
jgi:predicted SnoaL-like aldol condensation-catalyzing enzyme